MRPANTPPEAIVRAVEEGGARHRLLLFDFDGTLAEFADDPDGAVLSPSRAGLLEGLAGRADSTVGVVSGRQISTLRRRAALRRDVFFAGLHGLEIEGPGCRFAHPDAEHARDLVTQVREQVALRIAGLAGVVIEDKGLGFTVHWRRANAPAREAAQAALDETVARLVARQELRPQPGLDHCDVLPNVAWNKGEAVRWIARRVEQTAGRAVWPFFIGDDLTDEHAFEAIGSRGVTVVVGDRPSAARFRLADPAAVEGLLEQLTAMPLLAVGG